MNISILKGVHPGVILERELKIRNISRGQFALSVREYPQTISAIISGKRNMNTALALRIESYLKIEEGFFMMLQVFFDIKQEKIRLQGKDHPSFAKFRPAVFWDTKLEYINWKEQKKAVIKRVFERGNLTGKKEILKFYGRDIVREVLNELKKMQ